VLYSASVGLTPQGTAGYCFLALGALDIATSAEVHQYLVRQGVFLLPHKVRGGLAWLARKDLPMAEVTGRDRAGTGTPGQWRLTKRGRSVYDAEPENRLPGPPDGWSW
jgi:hypothetical protein